ncbi:MAG: hypothetical protein ABSE69_07160 [Roseiarcus sp.]|jgi:hypothetical protein
MAAAQEKSNDPTIVSGGELDPAAVLDLRRAIYAKGGVTRDDLAQLLARGRAAGPGACREYADLLAEAATDLLVRQVDPPGYVAPGDVDWLTDQLADGGGLSCRAEFAMLVDVLRYAVSAPPTLGGFAVREVEKAILTGRRAATGQADHASGVVTSADVEALRSLLFAPTEGTSLHVSRESAEALFDIAHATAGAANDPGFDDLFAKAIGNYLMGLSFRWTPTAAVAREHAQWADHATRFANFFSRMVEQPLARRFGGLSAATKTVDEIHEQLFAQENAADARALKDSGAIAASDADWVIAHLTRGGQLSPAEQRLLGFLGQEAASMPPSLRALVEKGR